MGSSSSRAATGPNAGEAGKTALGYAEASTLGLSMFSGQAMDATTSLIKYTYAGDANLDGQVDVTDLGVARDKLANQRHWTGGDFNYDGFVDVTDLGAASRRTGKPASAARWGRDRFDVALAAVGLGGQNVPEPATLASLGIVIGTLVSRRRRFFS